MAQLTLVQAASTQTQPAESTFGENQWLILGHWAFMAQLERYKQDAMRSQARVNDDWVKTTAGKKIAALRQQVFVRVPRNPSDFEFRLGNALGPNYRNWFRAKFLQKFRLFFRFSSQSKIIVYGWVTNCDTLRAYGSQTDAYLVFRRMLEAGTVPDNWDQLIAEAAKLSN
jgi:toxin YhaV